MAHRSMDLANRGIGLVARQFRVVREQRTVAALTFNASTFPSSHNNHDFGSTFSLRERFFEIDNQQCRSYSSTIALGKEYAPNPLDAFRDPVDRNTRMNETVGRQWSVKELRRKSYEDLHRLWYVLYKEKNMLLTEQQLSRRRQLIFPQPERFKKVQKSMGAIRQVLGERKRVKVAAHLKRHREKELAKQMTAELENDDAAFVEIEGIGSSDKDDGDFKNDTTK